MMRFGRLAVLFGLFALVASGASAGVIFSTIPADGHVYGMPGETVGWGSEVTNDTPYVLSLDGVSGATDFGDLDTFVFDFPFLAPHSTSMMDYVPGVSGLAELLIPGTAKEGDSGSGFITFYATLSGIDSDYSESLVFDAPIAATAVPEPATMGLLLTGLVGLAGRRMRKNR
jgi:hypothetical protein